MKAERYIRMLFAEPWAIVPQELWALVHGVPAALRAWKSGQVRIEQDAVRAVEDAMEKARAREPTRPYEMVGEVAVVRVSGVFAKDASEADEEWMGLVNPDRVGAALDAALAADDVAGIVLAMDSPGGVAAGVPELAEQVRVAAAVKPVVAWTDTMACSAAYWVASQATELLGTGSAVVGSVGVYLPLTDLSELYAKLGVKVHMIRGGKHKGVGHPGTELTEEQAEHLRGRVAYLYEWFVRDVQAARGIAADALEGQSYYAEESVGMGFVDGVCGLDAAIEEAATHAANG